MKRSKSFTQDFVSQHASNWLSWLGHLQDKPAKMLEVGSYEGRSACFFLDRVLTHDKALLICVDSWANGSPEFPCGEPIARRFQHNVAEYGTKCLVMRGESKHALSTLIGTGHHDTFDAAYVDGGHYAHETISDMVMAFHLLKSGGVMIVDDYTWSSPKTLHPPKDGVDGFLLAFRDKVDLIFRGYQVAFVKC